MCVHICSTEELNDNQQQQQKKRFHDVLALIMLKNTNTKYKDKSSDFSLELWELSLPIKKYTRILSLFGTLNNIFYPWKIQLR